MSRVNDTGHVKGRLRPLEKISFVLELYKLNEKVSSSLDNRRPVHLWKIVSFLTLVRVPFWPRFFTKLNCAVPVGLGFSPFLIKAVTLFLLIVRLF